MMCPIALKRGIGHSNSVDRAIFPRIKPMHCVQPLLTVATVYLRIAISEVCAASLNRFIVYLLRSSSARSTRNTDPRQSVQARNDTGKPINSWQFRDNLCVKTLTYVWLSDVRRSFILTRQLYRESITWQFHLETAAQSVPNISCSHIMLRQHRTHIFLQMTPKTTRLTAYFCPARLGSTGGLVGRRIRAQIPVRLALRILPHLKTEPRV